MTVRVLAFHGDFSNSITLRRDIGPYFQDWIFVNWKRLGLDFTSNVVEFLSQDSKIILAGYSKGGIVPAALSNLIPNSIAGAILYESPTFERPQLSFPVLWIENDRGKRHANRRTKKKMTQSKKCWEPAITGELIGRGRHIKTRPLGHNWDQSLNPKIADWINDNI